MIQRVFWFNTDCDIRLLNSTVFGGTCRNECSEICLTIKTTDINAFTDVRLSYLHTYQCSVFHLQCQNQSLPAFFPFTLMLSQPLFCRILTFTDVG